MLPDLLRGHVRQIAVVVPDAVQQFPGTRSQLSLVDMSKEGLVVHCNLTWALRSGSFCFFSSGKATSFSSSERSSPSPALASEPMSKQSGPETARGSVIAWHRIAVTPLAELTERDRSDRAERVFFWVVVCFF